MNACITRETFVFTVFRRVFHSTLKFELCRHACRRRDPIILTCPYGKNMPTTALVVIPSNDCHCPVCSPKRDLLITWSIKSYSWTHVEYIGGNCCLLSRLITVLLVLKTRAGKKNVCFPGTWQIFPQFVTCWYIQKDRIFLVTKEFPIFPIFPTMLKTMQVDKI